MADLRAEQIMAAVKTVLTGLTTTGSNVVRGKIDNFGEAELPAIDISQGSDIPLSDIENNISFTDSVLQFTVRAYVFESTPLAVEQKLNLVRKEVHAALKTSYNLGLAFVLNTYWAGQGDIERSGDGAKLVGVMPLNWAVHYRHSIVDASA